MKLEHLTEIPHFKIKSTSENFLLDYVLFSTEVDLSLKFVLSISKDTHTHLRNLSGFCAFHLFPPSCVMGEHFRFLPCPYSLIQMCENTNMHPPKFCICSNSVK